MIALRNPTVKIAGSIPVRGTEMRRNNQTPERGWAMPKVRPAGSTVMMGHDVPAPPSELPNWLEDPSGAPVGVQELLWWQVLEADAVELGRRVELGR
jgi:hypothetical protein